MCDATIGGFTRNEVAALRENPVQHASPCVHLS